MSALPSFRNPFDTSVVHCGFLNLNKPAGWTSRDVVNVVQRYVRPGKAGHAGTLDPLATGVLVIAVGRATRLIEYAQRGAKRYLAEFLLGRTSESDDVEAAVHVLENPPRPALAEIEAAAKSFLGETEQTPPAFSALKVGGRRAYHLARNGEDVELEPRLVRIDEIQVREYQYPKLTLEIACGSGTYVRALGRDLAAALGTGAVMASLTRTAVGPFRLEDGILPTELSEELVAESLCDPEWAVQELPRCELTDDQIRRLAMGQRLPVAETSRRDACDGVEYAAFDGLGNLLAVLRPTHGHWKIFRNLRIQL